ncbi:unnamed protein product [Peronospora belbahrii]|uniref:Uncharacterized protein n=1 Tax=Peronospora belbahrii TaxID=622444 RepID=A0AAU9KVS2_9STRA|nr:unnamed protein product [Peronospora belbahrii]CAH0519923.1 unnamed protein product [Peronospora belbahrii]
MPTPAPTEPCPTLTLVPEKTEALPTEEITEADATSSPMNPCPKLTFAYETEDDQDEVTTEEYSTPSSTIPCPKLTLVLETETSLNEKMIDELMAPGSGQDKESFESYTPDVSDVLLSSLTDALMNTSGPQTDEVALGVNSPCPEGSTNQERVVKYKAAERGANADMESKPTNIPTTDTIDVINLTDTTNANAMDDTMDTMTTYDFSTAQDLGDTFSHSLHTQNRNLRSN